MTTLDAVKRKTAKIMIVDDEPVFLDIAKDWLEPRYEVTALTNGSGLMDRLHADRPDILILDIYLRDEDGFSLCRMVRDDLRFWNLPILFLTASSSGVNFVKSLHAGGTSYLIKPLSGGGPLIARIEHLLSQSDLLGS